MGHCRMSRSLFSRIAADGRGCWGCPHPFECPGPCQGSRQSPDRPRPPHLTSSSWAALTAAPGREAGRVPRIYGHFCSGTD